MNLLITGATGFIGQAVARTAVRSGHRVIALTRNPSTIPQDLKDPVQWIEGTFADPPVDRLRALGIESCLHAAWIATPGVYLEAPENTDLVSQTECFARHLSKIKARRLVALGTCIEYAPSSLPLVENTSPLAPLSLYARCKNQTREKLEQLASLHSFELAWGRVFYPYGPGEHPGRLISGFIRQMHGNCPVVLKTPNSAKDFIHIRDLAEALLLLLTTKAQSGTYNLCTGKGVSIGEVARTTERLLGKSGLVETLPCASPDSYPFMVGDSAKIRALGWQPRVSLEDGIREMASVS